MYPGVHAAATPGRPAQIMAGSGRATSFAELESGSRRGARLLHALGLRPGDHVALLADNHPAFLEVVWAALRSGLYLTPVNRYLTAEEAAFIVGDCDARVLIASPALAEVAAEVRRRVPALEACLVLGPAAGGFASWEAEAGRHPAERLDAEPAGQIMCYSSGTTGRPKGVLFPLSGRLVSDENPGYRVFWGEPAAIDATTVCLIGSPLYHAAPLFHAYATQALGGAVVIQEKFDALETLALIERHRITHGFFVPTMFVRLLKLAEAERARFDLSSLRFAIHAGAPCPVEVKRRMIEWWGPVIEEYYSMTEEAGTTWITSREWLERPGSVGRSVDGPIHIRDDEGRPLPPGEIGTVHFEGGSGFAYHKDDGKTRAAYAAEGFATTGDLGWLDEDGYLFLSDRRDHLIISGGVNIYPKEIEDRLIMHPAVADVAVIGVPDEEFGEAVKAVVEPVAGADLATLEGELAAYCRQHLAAFKRPRSFALIEALPRLPTGKLAKNRLRERFL